MNRLFLLMTLFFYFSCNFSCSTSDKKTTSLLNSYKDKANQMANQAKIKQIEVAVKIYALEYGNNPDSVDELVEKGFLKQSDIVDQNGKKLPMTPSDYDIGSGSIIKTCEACGKEVSPSSKVGDRCPHCSVVWGYETQM